MHKKFIGTAEGTTKLLEQSIITFFIKAATVSAPMAAMLMHNEHEEIN
jgi:hypothetical protein